VIYPDNGRLYEAERYTRLHIERVHQSLFTHMLQREKSETGLSEVQRNLLALFYAGKSDQEIQAALGTGSRSTIRNHRFALKEKERQARLFLAIMEVLCERQREERWQEQAQLPRKENQRLTFLEQIAGRFHAGQTYTEKEVNAILAAVVQDHVTVRRYLVDDGFLERLPDGSQYWRPEAPSQEARGMDRRELKRQAMEIKTEAGVYQIKNHRNGKLFVEATRNLKTLNGQRFQLEMGSYRIKQLQEEWNQFGPAAFTFDVLEVLKKPETGYFDEKDELAKLKARWIERLQPFGEKGYNPTKPE